MTEIPLIWKIFIALFFLLMFAVSAFLGWRVLELMKRVKLLQVDRNELIEERNKLRLRELEELNGLSELEKRLILNALNMPEYGRAITDPKTSFQRRKVYRGLVEKIKENLE